MLRSPVGFSNLGLLLLLGLSGAPSISKADTVAFNTNSSQLCVGASGCGVATQTIGGVATVSFLSSSQTVNASPTTFASFGDIVVSCVGGGTGCGSTSLAGLNLYINIAQTAPSVGTGNISGGVVTGSVSGTASSALITWATPNQIDIGNIEYSIFSNPLPLVPPSSLGGDTTIQGQITATPVPLPATFWLLLSGLGGVVALRRRAPALRFC